MAVPSWVRDALKDTLSEHAFLPARAGIFQRTSPGGICAVSLVGDKWGGPAGLSRFTAHIGYFSYQLARWFGPEILRGVGPGGVHWYRWVGFIDPDDPERDLMWEVERARPHTSQAVVLELEQRILPILDARGSDAGIRDDWLRYEDPWLDRATQTSYLAVLLAELGPVDQLDLVVSEVRRLASAGSSDAKVALEALDEGDPL